MEYIKHQLSLPVQDFDVLIDNKRQTEHRRHGELLPNTVRCIICGPSNCGKTNVMLALILHPNGLRFENLYLFAKSLNQPKYQYLANVFARVSDIINFYQYTDNTEIVHPNNAKPNSLFIFDDVACEKQENIRAYFSMGRHSKIDCFYLSQTYTRIPKHLVRDNANLLILFKQDDMNLKHIYDDHVNTDMTYSIFRDMCSTCWTNARYGFLVIDKDRDKNNGRYRQGFDTFISIK